MSLVAINVKSGSAFTIYALEEDGRCKVMKFIEALGDNDRERMAWYIDRTADFGLIQNTKQFKPLKGEGGIFEFRMKRSGARIFCFRDDRAVILTNGYYKKTDPIDPLEKQRAQRLRDLYRSAKANKVLGYA